MRERLAQVSLISEIIGGVAIIVTLVFVGLELRQSNALATTDALKDATQIWTDAFQTAWGTEDRAAFFRKALHRCGELSDDEHARFEATLLKLIAAYDNVYSQYLADRLRREVFISIAAGYYSLAQTPCAQQVLTDDLPLMPPWLINRDSIVELQGFEAEIELPDFLKP